MQKRHFDSDAMQDSQDGEPLVASSAIHFIANSRRHGNRFAVDLCQQSSRIWSPISISLPAADIPRTAEFVKRALSQSLEFQAILEKQKNSISYARDPFNMDISPSFPSVPRP
jgi:hypothetical protein